jgi:DNA-binding helix-hairpin-helix protein with protein kinase domain
VTGGFIEDRVEQELALLEPPARQPLDLHEELGAEAAQDLFGLGLVAFEKERGEYPLAPGLVMAIIRAERLMHRRAKVAAQLFELRPQLLGGSCA